LVISDGLVEQTESDRGPDQPREQFQMSRVQSALAATKAEEDAVAKLFEAVYEFAGTQTLSDDATAVLVKW
jgi:serine phosphatase RsbU (regulator of sigma subunit)